METQWMTSPSYWEEAGKPERHHRFIGTGGTTSRDTKCVTSGESGECYKSITVKLTIFERYHIMVIYYWVCIFNTLSTNLF